MILALSILICVVVVVLLVVWQSSKRRERNIVETTAQELTGLIAELRGRIDALMNEKEIRTQDLKREGETYKNLTTQWNERVSAISNSLEKISTDATGKVEDMASQLKPIVSIFRSPQAAGIEFGEAELEMLLKTHLGEGLYLRKPRLLTIGQDVVDFAIKLPDCLVPIDSKFPSTHYRAWVEADSESQAKAAWRTFRDQLIREMETTAKYIKPDAGTTDYALVFVPSDVIYQQAFLTQRVYDQENPIPQRSLQLQVFGCSPQTLLPIFSLIRLGLRNLKIAEDVKGIRKQIDELQNAFFKLFLDTEWKTLREHVKQLSDYVDKMGLEKSGLSRVRETVKKLSDLSHERTAETPLPKVPETAELFVLQREDA